MTALVCDFCSRPNPTWWYRAEDFEFPPLPGGVRVGSEGSWAACGICKGLIDQGKRDVLARRSARRYSRMYGVPIARCLPVLRQAQDSFWAHRFGPPVPIKEVA
jgi:hypothetical protein